MSVTTGCPCLLSSSVSATPNSTAKKITCSMSPVTSDSAGLAGMMLSRLSIVDGASAARSTSSPAAPTNWACKATLDFSSMKLPGLIRWAQTRPMVTAAAVVPK